MKFFAHAIVSFIQSHNERKLNKCIAMIFMTKNESFISFSKKDHSTPLEYKLTNNIADIRTKFLNEGKITLQLKSPSIYIFLSQVSSSDLGKAVQIFVDISNNKPIDISKKCPLISDADKKLLKTTLRIDTIAQFPVTSGYPSNLHTLSLVDLKMKKFDHRILRLRSLHTLRLENLLLEELPTTIESMELVSLSVVSCRLTKWPNISPVSALARSLCALDLTGNRLTRLPEAFWTALPHARSVLLAGNALQALPVVALDRMVLLSKLDLTNNQLSVLPNAFAPLAARLTNCNLTGAFNASNGIPLIAMDAILPRMAPLQPISLLHSAILAVGLTHHQAFATLSTFLPTHIWLQTGVERRCISCRIRVSPACSRYWQPLTRVADSIAFGIEHDSVNPTIVYLCDKCHPVVPPDNNTESLDVIEPMEI